MGDEDRAGARRDGAFDIVERGFQAIGVDGDRHGDEAMLLDDADHVGDGHGSREDLAAGRKLVGGQEQVPACADRERDDRFIASDPAVAEDFFDGWLWLRGEALAEAKGQLAPTNIQLFAWPHRGSLASYLVASPVSSVARVDAS